MCSRKSMPALQRMRHLNPLKKSGGMRPKFTSARMMIIFRALISVISDHLCSVSSMNKYCDEETANCFNGP